MKYLFCLLVFFLPFLGFGQVESKIHIQQIGAYGAAVGQTIRLGTDGWEPTSSIFNTGTNVGIGTTTPGSTLHISGSDDNLSLQSTGNGSFLSPIFNRIKYIGSSIGATIAEAGSISRFDDTDAGAYQISVRKSGGTMSNMFILDNNFLRPSLSLKCESEESMDMAGSAPGYTSTGIAMRNLTTGRGQGLFLHDPTAEWFMGRPYQDNDRIVFARKNNAIHATDVAQTTFTVFEINEGGTRVQGDNKYYESSSFTGGSIASPAITGSKYYCYQFLYPTASTEALSFAANLASADYRINVASNITSGILEERFRINGSTGNCGINTTSPAAKIHVAGDMLVTNRTGIANSIAGWGSDNISRDINLSSELLLDVGTLKVNTAGITNSMIADDAISTSKIQAGSVTNGKIADNAIGTSKIISGSVTGLKIAAAGANVGDFYAYGGAGVGYVPTPATGDVTGPVSNLQIASGAVGAAEIASNAVTTVKIADNTVTSAKIVAQGVIPTSLQNPGGTTVTSIGSMPWWNGTAWIFGQNTQESFTVFTATGTVSASSSRRHSVFNPGSTQAAMTISLHPGGSPSPGQIVVCTFIDAVTALTVQSNGAAAVLGMPTTATAGKTYTFKFIDTVGTNGTWVLMQ